jgi:hypothetical protein
MAKKQAASAPPAAVASDVRISVYNLKGSPEYRDWLNGLSKKSLINSSAIIRDALSRWAKERGYPDPPEL